MCHSPSQIYYEIDKLTDRKCCKIKPGPYSRQKKMGTLIWSNNYIYGFNDDVGQKWYFVSLQCTFQTFFHQNLTPCKNRKSGLGRADSWDIEATPVKECGSQLRSSGRLSCRVGACHMLCQLTTLPYFCLTIFTDETPPQGPFYTPVYHCISISQA